MLYCAKCQTLTTGDCPVCGRRESKLRMPQAADPVFLLHCRMQYAAMVEPILAESNIPYSRSGALGAALATTFGSAFELYRFYVPYAAFPAAFRLISGIFGEDKELMKCVADYGMTDNRTDFPSVEQQNP